MSPTQPSAAGRQTRRGRLRALAARCVLALVGLAVGLGIAEIIVRAFSLAPKLRRIVLTGRETVFQRSTNRILG